MSQSWKRSLRLPEDFEIISERDSDQDFSTGDPRMDRYALRDYFQMNQNPNEICVVYKVEGLVAGVIDIIKSPNFLMIDKIGRNKLVPATRVGMKLMSLVEGIARQLGVNEIRLESLDSVIGWYDGPLGYSEYDESYNDPDFGRLTPKRKFMQG